ncbi:CHAT domain-containing protein [Flavobacterium sp. NG2]|uniref:CHAT domain-containing protein n=1 Tax=Flavobacterium sp. NG2 TaxID=3097547 RepID=UPI002A83DAFA|nr:CHAT domain-containing protein [Flavobacterium sp. NG2]WPR71889.1 CHAT domain-containing protein [Flavobacterium sp. NG2]
MIKKTLFFLLLTITVLGQNTQSLEDSIYQVIDGFVKHPSVEALIKLNQMDRRFWNDKQPKTKEELLAIVILNCNKGYYESQFGKNREATESYEKAWQLFQKNKLSHYDIVEFCLKPLGNLYTVQGDYDNAENIIKQYYYSAIKEKNQSQKIAAILNLSNVYQSAGKTDLAIDLVRKTIQTEKLSKTQKGIFVTNLGNNYLLNYKKALVTQSQNPSGFKKIEQTYLYAIQLLQGDKTQSETLGNCYRNLASLYVQERHYDKANDYFAEAKKLFFATVNRDPRKLAKLYYEEAVLLFEQQKRKEASALIESVFSTLIPKYSNTKNSLPNQKSLYAETILLDAFDLQAAIYSQENQPKKALEAYGLAFYIEDLFANLLIYENSKIITQTRVRTRTEKCIALYDVLYKKEHKQAYIESAFQLAEKTKSTVLKDYLLKTKTASRAEKLHLEQLQNWTVEIAKEQQKGDSADIVKINKAIEKQNELVLSLKKIESEKGATEAPEINIQNLFTKLKDEGVVLLNYFSGSEKTYCFTFENSTIQLKSFSNDKETTTKIWKFIDYFKDADAIVNDVKGYSQTGKIVYDILQLPRKTDFKKLLIIPDGILNFVSFEALITKESTTTNFAKMHYLVQDYAIGYNNSVAFYLNEIEIEKPRKNVLGVFPVFEKTDDALSFSKKEMASIKRNFEGRFFENEQATFDHFKSNASSYSILHLSTHASSGDVETAASIKFYDQDILYPELYSLKINPDLVVLSACETGVGKLYKSEGAMSVARGFQFAGARNLLFSLWKVNDFTTSVFMDYFYKYCNKGESYFEANQKAKLDFLEDKTISNTKKSPYYWSAFVYYGGVESGAETFNYGYLIFGFIAVIGLLLGFTRFKKWKKYKKS